MRGYEGLREDKVVRFIEHLREEFVCVGIDVTVVESANSVSASSTAGGPEGGFVVACVGHACSMRDATTIHTDIGSSVLHGQRQERIFRRRDAR